MMRVLLVLLALQSACATARSGMAPSIGAGAVDEVEMESEFLDESNPFYIAKKPKAEESTKPSYKDTSDAANDILRKMLERRRASR